VAAKVYSGIVPHMSVALRFDLFNPLAVGDVKFAGIWFVLLQMLNFGVILNVTLGVFNLIPFPPLDGFWIFKTVLPRKAAVLLTKIQGFGFILIIIAIQAGMLTVFFFPAIALLQIYSRIANYLI